MNPLSALYGAAIGLRNSLYDRGTLRARQLHAPVVSIGNIRVGGAGKTPFTICLGEFLKARGIDFDVLSRGYKRQTTGVHIVDPNGNAEEFGDEPLLIAKSLQVPVVVGEKRFDAGRAGEAKFDSKLHLLDDGFQHRQLARQFDIVLLDEADLKDTLLPTGRLREPVSALWRADVLVMPTGQPEGKAADFGKPVWRVRRSLRFHGSLPKRPLAFCGLARPDRFLSDLLANGVHPVSMVQFPDHHRYTHMDIAQLRTASERNAGDGFITTRKDVMNLGALVHHLPNVNVADLEVQLLAAENCLDFMLHTIAARHERRS